ncbi:hypothetical protein OPV22_027374 [Ensete ventricosum]|uniref:Uncharacterized protein n=1 Tax=Ensete ventricosum TaxID=4639 RepID=A0AAV8P2Y5_ENSVE|nr:hypothetical protein OPV22_027374 [Ensete ventricosum]RWW28865.1 hypothetical protein GW17_00006635 [Ensete ventricosum]RWW77626.1 hypothetical protein BHE74_00014203 [Ensete ventricosum]RZR76447.1 hypothetical protein BHM03_00001229 [Ensete ventricosum]
MDPRDRFFGSLPKLSFLFLTVNSFNVAYRSRGDPSALSFVVFIYVAMMLLFICLRRLEMLAPQDPPEHKKRTLAAIWVLATVLSLVFAWRVAEIAPPLLAVAMAGFYALIIYQHADGDSGVIMTLSPQENV